MFLVWFLLEPIVGFTHQAFADIYHRCGGTTTYRDGKGRLWQSDRSYLPGSWGYTNPGIGRASTTHAISGTDDDALYQTERYGPNVSYRYDGLANGVYEVTLKFCEFYWQASKKRIFDVAINNILFLDDLDIFARVGGNSVLDFHFKVKVTDGTLLITVPQVKADYAKFDAIAVVQAQRDAIAPTSPVNLRAYSSNGEVLLKWPRNSEPDIQGYNLYRSVAAGGPFHKINQNLIKGTSSLLQFSDPGLEKGETYFYYVTAVDASDNESANSKVISVFISGRERNFWSIPDAAWTRTIGDHPPGATGRTKRGIPLGGIGAGNFMFNLCGTFGPWEFKIGSHEEKFLSQAAFHIFEKVKNQSPQLKTLATEDVLPAWNRLQIGDGSYFALYPKAWFTYQFPMADVSLKQFTPIIPHNYRETSYPVGIFQFKLFNPTSDTIQIGLMFTFPNAGYADETRTGFQSRALQEDGVTGVILKAVSPRNSAVTQNTEWCIATKQILGATVTFTSSWDASGDGRDIYNEFGDDGNLNDGSLDNSHSAGAVAVRISLPPGQKAIVPFVLSWDFPIVRFGQGTEWYRRYTEYSGHSPGHSFQIAKEALLNYQNWEAEVDEWQSLIINEPSYPDWLKQGALNELYYDTFGGVFWEDGCITKPAESSYGTLSPDDHKYFNMECQAYPMCETFDVRHYECRHYLELWPEIERDVLRWFADYIANDPEGRAPHDEGRPDQDPFFRFSGYGSDWQDMPSKFIQQVYAYYHKTHDKNFLDFVWPACKKTYYYMKTKDSNYDALPDHGNTTYDTWGLVGDNLLCGGLWVGALEAMVKMAEQEGDSALLNDAQKTLHLAKDVLNLLFWKPNLGYYRLDMSSDAIMTDGLNGERYCETTGLDPILPPDRIASHLHQVFKRCVEPLTDFTGDGVGDMGAVNGRNSNGSPIGSGQADEIWTGTSYFVAAMMYHWGKTMGDEGLKEHALKTAYGVYYQTWVNEKTAYYFDTPEAWNWADPTRFRAQQYQRPRSIWELLLEIKNPFSSANEVKSNGASTHQRLPEVLTVYPNYPNPFNASTRISYRLQQEGKVTVSIFNVQGERLYILLRKKQSPGEHALVWQGAETSGVYFCRINVVTSMGNVEKTIKMILQK